MKSPHLIDASWKIKKKKAGGVQGDTRGVREVQTAEWGIYPGWGLHT